MPRRKYELTAKQWLARIEDAKIYRREKALEADWKKYENYYRGRFPTVYGTPGEMDNADQPIVVNVLKANWRMMGPQIYMQDPEVTLLAREPARVVQALVVEAAIDRVLRVVRLDRQLYRANEDAYIFGTGVLKTGYDREMGTDPAQLGMTMSFDEFGNPDAETAEMSDTREAHGQQLEYASIIRPGHPWVRRVDPREFLAGPATDFDDVVWCAFRIVRPMQDWKDDELYDHTTGLEANLSDKAAHDLGLENPLPEESLGEAWEIHDKKSGKVYVVYEGSDKFLRDIEDGLQVGGKLPAELIVFNDRTDTYWGESDVGHLLPQQLELNEVREMAREYRRICGVAMLVRKGVIDEDQMDKLYGGRPMPAIITNSPPGGDGVLLLNKPIPSDLHLWGESIKEDIREQSGLGLNQRGQISPQSHPPTAREVGIANQYAQTPLAERRKRAVDAMVRCVERMLDYMFAWWDDERYVSVVGPEGATRWVKFRMTELRAGYDIEVHAETSNPAMADLRKRELLELLQIAGQSNLLAMLAQAGVLDPAALFREILKEYPSVNGQAILRAGGGPQQAMSVDQLQQEMQGAQVRRPMPVMPQGAGMGGQNRRPQPAAVR